MNDNKKLEQLNNKLNELKNQIRNMYNTDPEREVVAKQIEEVKNHIANINAFKNS